MYLKRLNKDQKELFLDLCISAAMSNNVMENEEKQLIIQYCEEMQMDNARFSVQNEVDDAIKQLIEISTDEELRMILVELTALVLTDNQFDDLEKQFISKLIEKMNISQEEFEEIESSIKMISAGYVSLNNVVFS